MLVLEHEREQPHQPYILLGGTERKTNKKEVEGKGQE